MDEDVPEPESAVLCPSPQHTEGLREELMKHGVSLHVRDLVSVKLGKTVDTEQLMEIADLLGAPESSSRSLFLGQWPCLRTKTHHELLEALLWTTLHLDNNFFEGKRGISSGLFLGAKGTGKSTTLRTWTSLCPVLFPNVIPVFLNMNHVLDEESPNPTSNPAEVNLAESSVLDIVLRVLADTHGISPVPNATRGTRILSALRRAGRRALVIVDELDQLYRLKPAPPGTREAAAFDTAARSLATLTFLGDQASGLVSTILCGSSAVLPLLITCNGDDSVRREFPRLEGAPNLNGTKFRSTRLHSNTPVDLEGALHVLFPKSVHDENARYQARLCMLCAGATPRALQDFAWALSQDRNEPSRVPQGANTSKLYAGFLDGLLERMRSNNKKFVDALMVDGELSVERIMSHEWEKEFLPLTYKEAVEVWHNTEGAEGDVLKALLHLNDRCWLMLDGVRNSLPQDIFPLSVLQVLRHGMDASPVESFLQRMKRKLQEFAPFALSVGLHAL